MAEADDIPPSLNSDDDEPPALDDDPPALDEPPALDDDDDVPPSIDDETTPPAVPTSAKAEDANADGPTLREQMLEASAGALKKKKAARAKEDAKVTKNFGKESFKKGFLASANNSKFAVGTIVELHSLSAASLNGRQGKCGAFNEAEGRYAVTLLKTKTQKRKKVAVRPANLRRAPAADVIRPKKQPEKNPLQFQEVQEAMKATAKLQEDKSWVTPDLLKRVASNPKLAKVMQDPRFPQLMHAMQHNPSAVAESAKSDPSLAEFLKTFTELMGDHFTNLGEKDQTAKEEEARRQQEEATKAAAAK